MVDALLQRAHGLLGLHRLGADHVGDFQVERDILAVTTHMLDDRSTRREGVAAGQRRRGTPYRLLLVALSICSSRALLAPDDHQLIILAVTNVLR